MMAEEASPAGTYTISLSELPLCQTSHIAEVICLDCRGLFCALCAFHHQRSEKGHTMHDLKDLMAPGSELEPSGFESTLPPPDSRLVPLIERTRAQLISAESFQASFEEILTQFVSAAQNNSSFSEFEQRILRLRVILQSLTEFSTHPQSNGACSIESACQKDSAADKLSELDAQLGDIERASVSKNEQFDVYTPLFTSCVSTIGKEKCIGVLSRCFSHGCLSFLVEVGLHLSTYYKFF